MVHALAFFFMLAEKVFQLPFVLEEGRKQADFLGIGKEEEKSLRRQSFLGLFKTKRWIPRVPPIARVHARRRPEEKAILTLLVPGVQPFGRRFQAVQSMTETITCIAATS